VLECTVRRGLHRGRTCHIRRRHIVAAAPPRFFKALQKLTLVVITNDRLILRKKDTGVGYIIAKKASQTN